MGDEKKSILDKFEELTGLPSLKQVSETLQKFPDEKQLTLIKDVLLAAERVSRTGSDLDKVLSIIREINSIPPEKLEELDKILKRIDSIVKRAPEELVSFLESLKV